MESVGASEILQTLAYQSCFDLRPDLCNPKHTTDQNESAIHHTGLLAIHRKSLRGFFLIIYDKTQSLGSF
jgi:hypothetical protein